MPKVKTIHIDTDQLLVFGGPYSNLHALESLRVKAKELGFFPEQIICTGDVSAYCAFPEESYQFVREWGIHVIAGNVEISLRDQLLDCGCNFNDGSRCDLFSKQWFPYVQERISSTALKYISDLPEQLQFQLGNTSYHVLHGSYENTSEFIFKSTSHSKKKKILDHVKADVVLAGHSGIPFFDQIDNKKWINAGVIGMPANDKNPHTWFCTIQNNEPLFHPLHYNFDNAAKAMNDRNLLPTYAQTLCTGIWDSCDILPETEKRQQGLPLCF